MGKKKAKPSASQRKHSTSVHQKKTKRTRKHTKKEQLVGKIHFIEKHTRGKKFILNASTTGGRLQVYVGKRFVPQTGGTCSPDLMYIIPFKRFNEEQTDGDLDIQGYVTGELICQGTCERMLAVMSDVM